MRKLKITEDIPGFDEGEIVDIIGSKNQIYSRGFQYSVKMLINSGHAEWHEQEEVRQFSVWALFGKIVFGILLLGIATIGIMVIVHALPSLSDHAVNYNSDNTYAPQAVLKNTADGCFGGVKTDGLSFEIRCNTHAIIKSVDGKDCEMSVDKSGYTTMSDCNINYNTTNS